MKYVKLMIATVLLLGGLSSSAFGQSKKIVEFPPLTVPLSSDDVMHMYEMSAPIGTRSRQVTVDQIKTFVLDGLSSGLTIDTTTITDGTDGGVLFQSGSVLTQVPGVKVLSGVLTLTADAKINDLTVGKGAGNLIYNTALGVGALFENTTGTYNTANGYQALRNNTTGSYSTAVGNSVLFSNTTGGSNTAVGLEALFSNTTGSYNTAFGNSALYENTTGEDNSAFGGGTLSSNTIGFSNIAIGRGALSSNTEGYYNTAVGVSALYANIDGHHNTAIGNYAMLTNTTGYQNTATGYQAAYANTTGRDNAVNGYRALYLNTTGFSNTATGSEALRNSTIGNENTATGIQAMYANTAGTLNTATGGYSLDDNTTGNNNTATGCFALDSNTTGNNNTASGLLCLLSNTTGSLNVAMGYNTGDGITTGSGNTILGAQVSGLAANLTNNIILANGTGAIKGQHDGTSWTFTNMLTPVLTTTEGRVKHNKIVTAGYLVDTTTKDEVIICNSAVSFFAVTLPDSTDATSLGRHLVVKNKGLFTARIDAAVAGQLFSTSAVDSITLEIGDWVMLDCDGAVWNVSVIRKAWLIKSAAYTASVYEKIQTDTSGAAWTLTLPDSASIGSEILIEDATLSWGTNTLTIARNGLKINNGTTNYTANVAGGKLSCVYISAAYGWSIK